MFIETRSGGSEYGPPYKGVAMRKSKTYYNTVFPESVIQEADKALESFFDDNDRKRLLGTYTVYKLEETWSYSTLQEFFAAFQGYGCYHKEGHSRELIVSCMGADRTSVDIAAPDRHEIETIASVFEKHAPSNKVSSPNRNTRIYIGHGHNPSWRDLKDHLQDKHDYDVEAYEIGSRAGHAIRDILEEMLKKSSIAFLVMTGEDETASGKLLARQNVVHEVGLFQGKLGFNRAIVLLEDGTEEFSNIAGIQQIRFPKGRIRETFGDVLAVLKREFS
jgi:predicted nucleotide-binding protein